MKRLKVLVACEESQAVTKAFRALGHNAFSCDLQPCSGGYPEWHLWGDVRKMIDVRFDLVIFHPVCKYIANSGVQHLHTEVGRWGKLKDATDFFNLRHQFNADYVATENPIPHKYAVKRIGKYNQIFQPWQFGHEEMKATCLWLKNLPPLKHTNIVGPPPKDPEERKKWAKVHRCPPGPEREKIRSKTYSGVAEAMASQWSEYILSQKLTKAA